jgi:hypothetical protein
MPFRRPHKPTHVFTRRGHHEERASTKATGTRAQSRAHEDIQRSGNVKRPGPSQKSAPLAGTDRHMKALHSSAQLSHATRRNAPPHVGTRTYARKARFACGKIWALRTKAGALTRPGHPEGKRPGAQPAKFNKRKQRNPDTIT